MSGNSVEYLYEGGSNRVSQKIETEKIGPSGSQAYTTKYEYVQGEKLSKIIENVGTPLQRVTTFLYDEKGNLVGSIDPAGHGISHEYDSQGRRIRTSRELENGVRVVTAMAYDSLNNLTSLTDSLGNRTEYTYDPLGRLNTITYPDGSTQEYSYDSAGNLLQEKQRSGTVVANGYDNGNRLISRTITKAPGVEGTSTESYLYDGLSRLTKGTNDVSVVERRYDSLSSLIEEVQDGKSVQYGYDKVGNPTSIRYPNQRLVEREFDLLNRISRVKQGSEVISTMEFLGRSYRLASKGYQNGDLVKYLYDQGRRLVNSETKNKNNAILQSFGWGYDTLDLKSFEKRIHNGGKGDAFSYDALKRLTNVTFDSPTPETPTATGTRSRAITLDKLDNILKITDNENAMVTEIIGELEGKGKALNQYSKFNDLPLEYDKSGNLSAKGSRLFAYDYRNRLVRSSKGDDAVTFTYDIFGRQTSRTDLSGTQHFFYAGDQKIEERNASGQVNKHYLWGNGIDELLRLDIYNGNSLTPYYVHTDSIGSTTAITDSSGNLVERVTYDVYGVPTFTDALGQTLKKSTIRNTTLFQGREYDYDLALYNYRARYLDPIMGRFLQTDPLGYQDSMNLYQGMGMNPVNFVDPLGMYSIDFHYYVIYYILRAKGWGKNNSNLIAGFSQFVDDSSLTSPGVDNIDQQIGSLINSIVRVFHDPIEYFHFHNSKNNSVQENDPNARFLVERGARALKSNNDPFVQLGAALHIYADTFAHQGYKSGFSYNNTNVNAWIHLPMGHADAGSSPDVIIMNDVNSHRAMRAAKSIWEIIPENTSFTTEQDVKDKMSWEEFEKVVKCAFLPYSKNIKRVSSNNSAKTVIYRLVEGFKYKYRNNVKYDKADFQRRDPYFKRKIRQYFSSY